MKVFEVSEHILLSRGWCKVRISWFWEVVKWTASLSCQSSMKEFSPNVLSIAVLSLTGENVEMIGNKVFEEN